MYKVTKFEFKTEEREKEGKKYLVSKRMYVLVDENLSFQEAKILRTLVRGQIVRM